MYKDVEKVDKYCFECNAYNERTLGTGYCYEWDTIVEIDDVCIETIELMELTNIKNKENELQI